MNFNKKIILVLLMIINNTILLATIGESKKINKDIFTSIKNNKLESFVFIPFLDISELPTLVNLKENEKLKNAILSSGSNDTFWNAYSIKENIQIRKINNLELWIRKNPGTKRDIIENYDLLFKENVKKDFHLSFGLIFNKKENEKLLLFNIEIGIIDIKDKRRFISILETKQVFYLHSNGEEIYNINNNTRDIFNELEDLRPKVKYINYNKISEEIKENNKPLNKELEKLKDSKKVKTLVVKINQNSQIKKIEDQKDREKNNKLKEEKEFNPELLAQKLEESMSNL